ncbi:hypothetical protein [Rhizobium sp. NZLR11]|uniref:hypothetical protein n=1 Tax=Rhizobium sp. NZLR11 TaxID=2731098 RepID=UPI001C8320D2|nr:hypothetical protein [Rhizobium sp. NZLR11]MBX5206710.1 hypothetical protein [Rhizobium sp. NZLR11]
MTTFTDFYVQFPRKKARGDAEKAWAQALKKGYTPETIMAGLMRNLADLQRREPQFIPYPATWLRSEAFFDEPDPIRSNTGRRTSADAARDFNARFAHLDASFGLPQLSKH